MVVPFPGHPLCEEKGQAEAEGFDFSRRRAIPQESFNFDNWLIYHFQSNYR
jgi:hypothetical protein